MEQLIEPNLDITNEAGRCLEFTESSFGTPHLYNTAWQGWEATKFKHQDRNFPNLTIPIWFDWTGTVQWTDGIWRTDRYGHVAYRTPDGVIHSAPGVGSGHATFNSVDDLCNYFGNGMKYVGWSEDLAGIKIIGDNDMNPDEVKLVIKGVNHRDATPQDIAAWAPYTPYDYIRQAMTESDWLTQNHKILFFDLIQQTAENQQQTLDSIKSLDPENLKAAYEALGKLIK